MIRERVSFILKMNFFFNEVSGESEKFSLLRKGNMKISVSMKIRKIKVD